MLWLWCSLAAAALIQPLAWELPYAAGATLKKNLKIKIKRLCPDHLSPLAFPIVKATMGGGLSFTQEPPRPLEQVSPKGEEGERAAEVRASSGRALARAMPGSPFPRMPMDRAQSPGN